MGFQEETPKLLRGVEEVSPTSGGSLLIIPTSAFQVGPSVTVTCSEGKWNKQVACEPVDCGVPDQHHVHAASFSCLQGTTFGSKCSFQCRHPAQLKGMEEEPSARWALLPLWDTRRLLPGTPPGLRHPGLGGLLSALLVSLYQWRERMCTVLLCSQGESSVWLRRQ